MVCWFVCNTRIWQCKTNNGFWGLCHWNPTRLTIFLFPQFQILNVKTIENFHLIPEFRIHLQSEMQRSLHLWKCDSPCCCPSSPSTISSSLSLHRRQAWSLFSTKRNTLFFFSPASGGGSFLCLHPQRGRNPHLHRKRAATSNLKLVFFIIFLTSPSLGLPLSKRYVSICIFFVFFLPNWFCNSDSQSHLVWL